MQSLKGIRWGKHPPGMEQVTLSYNAATGGVDMSVDRVSNPNQPYKPVGMLKVRVLRLCWGVLGRGGCISRSCNRPDPHPTPTLLPPSPGFCS